MKILIGDDHSVVRKGLIQIIQEEFPLAIITEAADGKEMNEIAKLNKFDIIISDISMPNRMGLNFITEFKQAQPSTPILILTMHASEQYELRCIRAGANGFLNKESATEELILAINSLLIGVKYVSKEVATLISNTKSKN
jgi:two-component system, NarL family, invasion response regulator UvrY